MFQNKMVTPAIPERVYTLCKIVEKKATSTSEVKEKMEPSYLNQKSSYYNDYKNAFEDALKLCKKDDLLLISGSLYMIGEMRGIIKKYFSK